MRRLTFLAILFGLFIVPSVRSDLRPPPRKLKYIEPRVSFDGVDKHPDLAFVLRFSNGNGTSFSPPVSFEIKDTQPFTLTGAGKFIADMHVLAIDRKEFDKRKADDPKLGWLSEKTPGVLKAGMRAPSTTILASATAVPVTAYRVAINDGKMTVDMVSPRRSSSASPEGPLPAWGFGILCALSFSMLGLWCARRRGA